MTSKPHSSADAMIVYYGIHDALSQLGDEDADVGDEAVERGDDEARAALWNASSALSRLLEQLEAAHAALRIALDYQDVISGPDIDRIAAALGSNPASDPLGLDQADRDFAEGKARLASEVFADLGLDSNQESSRDS